MGFMDLYSMPLYSQNAEVNQEQVWSSSLSRLWQSKNLVYPHSNSSPWLYGPNQYSGRQCASQQFQHCLAFFQTPEGEETNLAAHEVRYRPVAKVTQLIRAACQ